MSRAQPYDRDTALNSAMTLFWEKGYHAASLKDIEAALKMKPGSIYAAFGSKEGLFLEALDRYFESTRSLFLSSVDESSSPLTGLVSQFTAFADLPETHEQAQTCMLLKTLVDTKSTDPHIADRAKSHLSTMVDEFTTLFEKAKEEGELSKDADAHRLARRYQANIMAIRMERHLGTATEEVKALAEDMAAEFERLRV
ncbi:TetR/AcrR family transcriptional regulator [Candidatus Terasakiella magnetica]|nr:TetR/AcrR family transcriptional regulator [Candidatus Terasakiella magnetica]